MAPVEVTDQAWSYQGNNTTDTRHIKHIVCTNSSKDAEKEQFMEEV